MSAATFSLELVTIPLPCTVPWSGMAGDNHVRHCSECRQNVYDLSALTRKQAEDLLRKHEGRLCARFYRRPDGTILTKECPGALRSLCHGISKGVVAVVGVAVLFLGWLGFQVGLAVNRNSGPDNPHRGSFWNWLNPDPPVMVQGDICIPPPPQEIAPPPRVIK